MHWLLREDASLQPCGQVPPALQFGFSVYTTFLLPLEDCWLEAHLDRLIQNAQTLEMGWHFERPDILSALGSVVRGQPAVVRLTAFPEIAQYADFYSSISYPACLLLSLREPPLPQTAGISLKSLDYQRPMARIKHGAMLDAIHFKRLAMVGGYDDVLFVNRAGHLAEASTANMFLLREGQLLTPDPERDDCLPGITRQRIMAWAARYGVPLTMEPLTRAHISQCHGAFLSNAVSGLRPVARIDEQTVAWSAESRALLRRMQEALFPQSCFSS